MSYADLLYRLPADRLRQIVRRRAPTLRSVPRISDKRELANFLSSALCHYTSVVRAIEDTTLPELRVLVAVVARGGDVPFSELVKVVGAEKEAALAQTIDGLELSGLALWDRLRTEPHVFVPKAVRDEVTLPPSLRHPLHSVLEKYDVPTLSRICENLGLSAVAAPVRAPRVTAITREVTDPERFRQHLERLSEEAQRVFSFLVERGGAAYVQEIAFRMDARRRSQLMTSGWPTQWAVGKPRNGVEELLGSAMAVLDVEEGWGRWQLVIPIEVLDAAVGFSPYGELVPDPPPWQTTPAGGAAPQSHDSLIRDIAFLLGFLGRTEAARTGTGNIHRNALKALARGLTVPTVRYAEFVYAVSRDAGLIAPKGRKGLYDAGPRARSWLNEPEDAELKALYDAWRGRVSWAEPYSEPLADGRTYRDSTCVAALRESALTLLTDLAQERPAELASFESLAARGAYRWWSRFRFGNAADDEEDEETPAEVVSSNVEAMRRICAESLFWLGLTEVVRGVGGTATHVRLSPRGRLQLLGEPTPEAPPPPEAFVLQPNLEIYAPPNLPARILHRLFRLAEPTGSGMLALSKDSLRRALDRGENATSLLKFFKQHSQTGVPQNVEYLIKEVGGRHGHIKIGQAGLYLQVSDPVLLKELKAHKGLKIHFREDLADTVALITGDSVDAVLRQLRQVGYFPVASDDKAEDAGRARSHYKGDEEDDWDIPSGSWYPAPTRSAVDLESRIDWKAIEKVEG